MTHPNDTDYIDLERLRAAQDALNWKDMSTPVLEQICADIECELRERDLYKAIAKIAVENYHETRTANSK